MSIIFVLLTLALILLTIEKWTLNKSIAQIEIRIHVNGTRGKSTVTEYIAQLLRSNEITTLSKITGVIPTLIFPDGSKHIIRRNGGARVNEQFGIIRKAVKLKCKALVMECMSIKPELQKVESSVFKPHFYVITNIREDHLEEIGVTPQDWIKSICSAIPPNSIVITSERKYRAQITEYANAMNSKLLHVDELQFDDSKIQKENIFVDNLKIALTVAKQLKFETKTFLKEISELRVENNELTLIENDKKINFINAFAVNDVLSAEILLERILKSNAEEKNVVMIFNSRSDRPMRSKLFAQWFTRLEGVNKFIITGNHRNFVLHELKKNKLCKEKIIVWNKNKIEKAKGELLNMANGNTSVIGVGNIKGDGFKILESLGIKLA